jgi:hypothetical protein
MQQRWLDMVAREGTGAPVLAAHGDGDGEPPCPACGTAAPPVDGACSDCGLYLG